MLGFGQGGRELKLSGTGRGLQLPGAGRGLQLPGTSVPGTGGGLELPGTRRGRGTKKNGGFLSALPAL